jgi:hypothetical protein
MGWRNGQPRTRLGSSRRAKGGDDSYKGDASATDPDGKGDVPWIAGGPSRSSGFQRGFTNDEAEHRALDASVSSPAGT